MDPLACRSSFCTKCGTLLMSGNEDSITCLCCGADFSYGDLDTGSLRIVTTSEPKAEPRWVQKRKEELFPESKSMSTDFLSREKQRATVDEICPKCSHKRASFYTMQLRSVDEGQTVFYECLKCAHTWSQNN